MIMRVKELREARGMNQTQLAERMGVLQSAVSNWETETALPRARQLPKLAEVLECTIDELYVAGEEAG